VDSTILTKAHNVRAEGTMTCTAGETALARLKVNQPDAAMPLLGQANGHFGFDTNQPCTGDLQPWHSTLNLRKALPILTLGSAHFSATVRTNGPSGCQLSSTREVCCDSSSRGLCGLTRLVLTHPFDQYFEASVTLS
jgi:hypothetical protein